MTDQFIFKAPNQNADGITFVPDKRKVIIIYRLQTNHQPSRLPLQSSLWVSLLLSLSLPSLIIVSASQHGVNVEEDMLPGEAGA